jgi:hypothetical protein
LACVRVPGGSGAGSGFLSVTPGSSVGVHVANAMDAAASMDCKVTVVSDSSTIGFNDFSTVTASDYSASVL